MKRKILCGTFFFTFLVICFVLVDKEGLLISKASTTTKIYLSPSGSDSNNGSASSPLKSIDAALSQASHATTSDVEIILTAGTYKVSETINFNKWDGSNSKKLKITNNGNDKVVISGSKSIAPSKFNKNGNIYSTSISGFKMGGKSFESGPQLYIDNKAYHLAQYPNKGYANSNDSHFREIKADANSCAIGYFGCDYSFSSCKVESIDSNGVSLKNDEGNSVDTNDSRMAVCALSELDYDGEYYIDYTKNMLYFYSSKDISNMEIELSQVDTYLVYIENKSNIEFLNLTFSGVMGNGFWVLNSDNIVWTNCDVCNTSDLGVLVAGGNGNIFQKSRCYNNGSDGLKWEGGDSKTLTKSTNRILNSGIHDFALLKRTYTPGIALAGVGLQALGNKIYNSEHIAMKIDGNNNIIKGNEFYNCTTQTSDAGVIYADWDYMAFGNVIDSNYIHDFAGFKDAWTVGIYIDDQFSGTTVTNNYIEKGGQGIMIGGGSFNTVKDNIIVDMDDQSFYYDNRGLTWANDKIFDRENRDFANTTVYMEAYPGIQEFIKNPAIPLKAVVTGNKYYNCAKEFVCEPEVIKYGTVSNNVELQSRPANPFKYVDYTNGVEVTPIKDNSKNTVVPQAESQVESQNETQQDINDISVEPNKTEENLNDIDKTPRTSDDSNVDLLFILLFVSIIAIIAQIILKKRRNLW